MSTLAEKLAKLSPEKRKHLAARLRGDGGEAPQLTASSRTGATRPSAQQEQLWFLEQTGADPADHNVVHRFSINGALDADRLVGALGMVVARQSALDTPFGARCGASAGARFRVDRVDLSGHLDPDETLKRLMGAEKDRPLSAEDRPLARATLVRYSDLEHYLVWSVHQAGWDAASVPIFLRDLGTAYGEDVPAGELEITYADFSDWQRRVLQSREAELTSWWRSALAHHRPTTLPLDHPRASTDRQSASSASGRVVVELADERSTSELADIGRQAGVELSVVVFGLLAVLLSRWNRQDEVVLGWTGDVRPDKRLGAVVGLFSNVMPVTAEIDLRSAVMDFLRNVGAEVSRAIDHRDLPFAQIVAAVNPQREAGRNPIVDLEYSFESADIADIRGNLGDCRISLDDVLPSAASVDASFVVRECDGALALTVSYRHELFERSSVAALVDSFREMVSSARRNPRSTLGELTILSQRQHEKLTSLGDGGPSRIPEVGTVVDAILAHAVRTPDAEAVRYDGRSYSYRSVVAAARAVAAALVEGGVEPGDRVLLLSRQSPAAVSAALATSMVGTAYVPLDVEAPLARLQSIVHQTGAQACLVGSEDEHALARDLVGDGMPIVDLESVIAAPLVSPGPSCSLADPSSVAYVIFTSGSTGTPKGVIVSHRALLHFCEEIVSAYTMRPADRVLAFARPSFDVSVFEVFATLHAGGTVCVATAEQRRDPRLVSELMRSEQVSVAELPPALMPQLDTEFPHLRLVSVGGEAFPGSLVGPWTQNGREFWNGYGPTETTVAVTLMRCEGEWLVPPPIGRPLPGLRAHVLGTGGERLPPGAVGELCIAGPSLADGYLNDPAATARVFVREPGSNTDRLYRTGDLARWRPDGNLDFHGRNDRQVQVNGFRVELSEVEQVLDTLDGVRRGMVEFLDHPTLGRCLAAFVVAADDREALDVAVLRRHAADRLPEYAVPRKFVLVGDIPLTPNGKVDRSALEVALDEADACDRSDEHEYVMSATERRLAEALIGPTLGVRNPDPEARFFEMGGNSLQVTQVVGAIREEFNVRVTIADFFRDPTIRGLAARIDASPASRTSAAADSLLSLRKVS